MIERIRGGLLDPTAHADHGLALRSVRRSQIDAAPASDATLGALAWGTPVPAGACGVAARLLAPAVPHLDVWLGGAAVRSGCTGPVQWRDDGTWLFGSLEVGDADLDLAEVSRRAYLDLFAALQATGRPQLWRVWNYLPRINEASAGLERYRQFNIGRQQAFAEAGRDAFEGAPAACALGTRGGGLALRFLAASHAALPLENPRQVPAYRYSPAFGPRSPTFSRAVLGRVDARHVALLVSGTASIVGEQSLHPHDVAAQTDETLRNLQALFEAAAVRSSATFTPADFQAVVYLRHAEHLDIVQQRWAAWTGPAPGVAASAVYLEADVCRSELLVEIEGHAFSPGVLR